MIYAIAARRFAIHAELEVGVNNMIMRKLISKKTMKCIKPRKTRGFNPLVLLGFPPASLRALQSYILILAHP